MKQQYDSYKPSGIDWIGDIPSHWKRIRLKHIGESRNGLTYSPNDVKENGKLVIRSSNIQSSKLSLDDCVFVDNFPELLSIKKGDTIICSRNGSVKLIGKSVYIDQDTDMTFGAFMMRFRPNQSPKFTHYLLNHTISHYKGLFATTTINQLTSDSINQMEATIPPLPEQEAIAAWLDEKCGEIDTAITKVDREIELIEELKQSEISRVVTRGLNPDAPLRPSGIDWIGNIPSHWFNTRIKYNILRSAAGVWGDDEKGNENDIVCFRIADFDYDERCLSTDKITIRNIDPKQLEGRYLSKGDLLIEKSGGGESTPVGRVVYCNYNGKATYTNFIHSITLSEFVDSRFFLYYFNMLYSNKINLLFFNQTTGLQNLQVSDYLGQSICLPPLTEQQAIADYLDKKCAEIDGLKAKLSKKCETLTELRQSIISEVVTGKRKVI